MEKPSLQNHSFVEDRSIWSGIKNLPKHLNLNTISAGLLAGIFGMTTTLIIVGAANDAGLSQTQTISWVFACWFFGPVIGFLISMRYKQPIPGAWSIPGAALVAGALQIYTLQELQSAFLAAGIIVLVLGLTGVIGKIMRFLPMPIVMAMIAGAMLRFATGMSTAFVEAPLVVGTTILAFLIASKYRKKVPPILVAFIVSIIMASITGQFNFSNINSQGWILPAMSMPTFDLGAILSVAVPLAILVIGAENAQATGVLMSQGYKPPVNAMTIVSGIGGIIASLFGGHNANIAGPMTAICASEESGENKKGRYAAVFVNAIICGSVGLFASIVVPFIAALPASFIAVVAGLAMISVILSSFQEAFNTNKGFQIGAFFAFAIAASGVKILGIGAPFWALLFGVIVSAILESRDFKTMKLVKEVAQDGMGEQLNQPGA
jgi:benzoate membrane transport protein